MTNRKWTKEEDLILLGAIKKDSAVLAETFRQVAKRINRTPAAVSYRWYAILSKDSNTGVCFTSISATQCVVNNKIGGTPKPIKRSIWSKIKELLGLK